MRWPWSKGAGTALEVKAGGSSPVRYPGSALHSWLLHYLPGTHVDFTREVGPPWLNSAVGIGISWYADNFSEPRAQVTRENAKGEPENVPGHPLLALLETPNPYDDGDALWMATLISYLCDGNAYWIKQRSAGGTVRALWYVPHWGMRYDTDAYGLPTRFVYTAAGQSQDYPLEDVIHFRYGKDPNNLLYGLSRLKPVFREIYTDNQAATITAALLKNGGIPSLMLKPANPDVVFTREKRDQLKERWKEDTSGDNAGGLFVPNVQVDLEMVGYTPEQLGLYKIRQVPEARICGALRISPMVLDLDVGLENSTYSNKEEATKQAYLGGLIPLQRRMARTLTHALLPDFESDPAVRFGWDYGKVPALAENQLELSQRVVNEKKAGIWTIDESRIKLGGQPLPDGEGEMREPMPPATPFDPNAEPVDDTAPGGNGTAPSGNGKKPVGKPTSAKDFRAYYAERASQRRRDYERAIGNGHGHGA